jgi:hypothetical protein
MQVKILMRMRTRKKRHRKRRPGTGRRLQHSRKLPKSRFGNPHTSLGSAYVR